MFGKVGGRTGGGRRGGGNGNRNLRPSTIHRPMGPTSTSRLSAVGGGSAIRRGRGRGGRQGTDRVGSSSPAVVTEESFSLTSEGPFDFGSIIRHRPDLIDEIQRAEEMGVQVRIKFDSNSNDSAVNVIDVGGKEYSFTWSNDVGPLCDIYAECRNGETGNGLLVECGSSWRKLNVQPCFDESAKKTAKKRSEEVLQNKARRAIILELPNQPSAAAVEVNMRKNTWKPKESPLKKQKTEINQSLKLGSSKTIAPKAIAPTSLHSKVGQSTSPFSSPPEKTVHPNLPGEHFNANIVASFAPNHENAATFENKKDESIVQGPTVGNNHGVNPQHADLRNMLINLLSQKPHGVTLRGFENAVKKEMPNSLKALETVLKSIAIFKAPGKYILKPDVGLENSNMPLSECESFQDNVQERATVADTMKNPSLNDEFELQSLSNPKSEQEPFKSEKNDKESLSPDPISTDRKINDENDEEACTSSGSDSDSDSDSSDSGSDSGSQSRSRSKSKSPVASGSASSSDSDSDASSSSNETDVDVDITTTSDDEKDGAQSKCKSLASELLMLSSPGHCSEHDEKHNKKVGNKQDDNVRSLNAEYDNAVIDDNTSQAVKNNDRKTSEYHENGGTVTQMISLNGHKTASESLQEMMNIQSNQHTVSEIDKVACDGSLANGEHEKFPLTNKANEKSSKSKNFKKPLAMQSLDEKKGKGLFASSDGNKRNNTILSEEAPYVFPEKSEQKNKRKEPSSNTNPTMSFSAEKEKSEGKCGRSTNHGESTPYANLEESDAHIRSTAKVRRVNTAAGVKSSLPELQNKLQKDNGQSSHYHSFGMDNFGKESTLQRTVSELEVGEFREPLCDDMGGSKTQMDSPPKPFENELNMIEDANLDLVKQKASGKTNSGVEVRSRKNQGFQKKVAEIPVVESTRPEQPQHLLRPTFTDSETSHFNNTRSSYCSEPRNVAPKKSSFGCYPNGNYVSESTKVQKVVESKDDPFQKKDAIIQNGQSICVKKIKSSPEEDLLFSTFERDKPEEKGPISDFNQCKEYVQEYEEKKKCYVALGKHLEKIRDECLKIGGEFPELSKMRGTRRYNDCVQRLYKFHRLNKARHGRLMKTYDVLRIELKTLKQMINSFAAAFLDK